MTETKEKGSIAPSAKESSQITILKWDTYPFGVEFTAAERLARLRQLPKSSPLFRFHLESYVAAVVSECFQWKQTSTAGGEIFRFDGRSVRIAGLVDGKWWGVRMDSDGDEVGAYLTSNDLSVDGIRQGIEELLKVPLGTRLVFNTFVDVFNHEALLRAAMLKSNPEFKFKQLTTDDFSTEFEFSHAAAGVAMYIHFQDDTWFLDMDKSEGDDAWEYDRRFKVSNALVDDV